MENSCLEGQQLTHSYGQGVGRTTVLNRVTVSLRRGELVLVMGPSGCGKSTLLAVMSGLMRPEGGQILALGDDLWQLSAYARKQFRQRHFGFIFQGFNLFPALTARQQLEIVLRWGPAVPSKEARRRADKVLGLLGLDGKGDLRPAQLSGGEKQRVAIGRAIIQEPEFVFADEPTSALDWAHGRQVVELLRSAATTRAASVFVVSHDMRVAPYADRILHLDAGQVKQEEQSATVTKD